MYNSILLQPNRDNPIRNRHHWIFSRAIKSWPKNPPAMQNKAGGFQNGDILEVKTYDGKSLGFGYFNNKTTIAGRMLNFTSYDPIETLKRNIEQAYNLRKNLFDDKATNSYRLINAEGDLIPGLTVDKYANSLVIQVSTLGIEKLKPQIVEMLVEIVKPEIIYEKSNMPARRIEGLESFQGFLYRSTKHPDYAKASSGRQAQSTKIEFLENGFKFELDFEHSHKTGFYLDQREMRDLIGNLAKDKRVLNCFSYTGGFSIYAAKNGAKHVTSVDISKEVIEQSKQNFILNGLNPEDSEFYATDAFDFLRNDNLDYDIVILDPPAFAKKKDDFKNAFKAYKKLNTIAFKKMPKNSLLLTCSCSYHVDEESFKKAITEAATEAKRTVKILQNHRHALDHVINLNHPELNYLKSYLLYIS